tara:strand:+ start:7103 stop:7345 length:243 start_codon:yes stop_codon:yes gene_type:complete
MTENIETLAQIYENACLTKTEQEEMQSFISGDNEEIFCGTTQFEKLYEYFAFTTRLMPYANARGKTATPDDWILDFLSGI